jgi:hypothetical protein
VYAQLLATSGQTILRLDVEEAPEAEPTMDDLTNALGARGCLPIGVELAGGEVVLQPRVDRRFARGSLRAVFVLGEPTETRRAFSVSVLPAVPPS